MQRSPHVTVILTFILITLACGSGTPDGSGQEGQPELSAEKQLLPDFSLMEAGGEQFSNKDLAEKVVLLNFWATWCGPCRIEMPWFIEFQRKYKDKGFTVLAISLDEEGWEVVRPFLADLDANFPVVVGDDELSEDFGGIYALPTTLIIDRSGNIVSRHTGLVSKASYESDIEALL